MNTQRTTRPTEIPTTEEIQRLLAVIPVGRFSGRRMRTMVAMMWRTGLRCQEVLDLDLRDIDLEAQTVRVRNGKGGKARTVGMDRTMCQMLEVYLDYRNGMVDDECQVLYPTRTGKRTLTSHVRRYIQQKCQEAGIKKDIHAHSLRHAHAVELAREGKPLYVIQRQLGHASAATTALYLSKIYPGEVIEAIKERPWKAT